MSNNVCDCDCVCNENFVILSYKILKNINAARRRFEFCVVIIIAVSVRYSEWTFVAGKETASILPNVEGV